jgi:uncharacterized membrane protein (UPF0127 family)
MTLPFALKPLAAAALAGCLLAPAARAETLEALTVETAGGPRVFQVEVMRTDEQRARGLMYRRHMPEDRGMLFDFKTEQPVSMWMKNTYLPLDMLFIAKDGKVTSVAENAEPMSERIIPGGTVLGVLEINAGVAAKLGIKAGDKVRHPTFGPTAK